MTVLWIHFTVDRRRARRRPSISWFAIAPVMALLIVACVGDASPPPPDRMAAEVTRLGQVIPIVNELQVTDFEDSPYCRNLAYVRGTFGDLAQDGCARDGTIQFDTNGLADHARLAQAISATNVPTDRIRAATFTPEGDLETAWFVLEGSSVLDFWEYLYDPVGAVPKQDVPDQIDFTPVAEDWWFVWTPDD